MATFDVFEVIRAAQRDGGGTFVVEAYDANGWHFGNVRVKDGFFVGLRGGIENLPNPALTPEVISAFIAQFPTPPEMMGLWRDPQGKWSIDSVVWTEYFDYALRLGAENGQRAIWDIAWEQAWDIDTGDEFFVLD